MGPKRKTGELYALDLCLFVFLFWVFRFPPKRYNGYVRIKCKEKYRILCATNLRGLTDQEPDVPPVHSKSVGVEGRGSDEPYLF